jgi:hypothetical protein
MNDEQRTIGIGVGLSIAPGAAVGAALDNVGLGVAIGVAIGAAVGTTINAGRSRQAADDEGNGQSVNPTDGESEE